MSVPEPFTNVAASTAEDVATVSLLALAMSHPVASTAIALILVISSLWLILTARRLVRRLVRGNLRRGLEES